MNVYSPNTLILIGTVGGGVQLGPLSTAATNRPIVPTPVVMMMEKLVEWWLAGETQVLGGNLAQYRFVHHKPHTLPERELGPSQWKSSD
jgi:hypothetical protein